MVQYRQLLSNWVHKTSIRRHIVIDTAIQPTIQPGATKQNVAINDISGRKHNYFLLRLINY